MFLSKVFRKKDTQKSAIQLAYENYSVIGQERHINAQNIINQFKDSDYSLDILAVAFSYVVEGAKYRNLAIDCFEKYLENPIPTPIVPNLHNNGEPVRMFSQWTIYSTLADLYEKEYEFEKAIYYLNLLPEQSNYTSPADYIRIGNVLKKIDINKCVAYYEDLKTKPIYKKFKRQIDLAYKETLKLQEDGYVYKPRRKKK